MINIAVFVGEMAIWSLNVLRILKALKAIIKKNDINLDSSLSNSSSHGHALFSSNFYFNAKSTSSYNKYLIDYGTYFHMAKDKIIFSTLYFLAWSKGDLNLESHGLHNTS